MTDATELLARENDAEMARLTGIIFDLTKALQDIKAATLDGRVCDDVAWFGPAETLHDFCDRILDGVSTSGEAK